MNAHIEQDTRRIVGRRAPRGVVCCALLALLACGSDQRVDLGQIARDGARHVDPTGILDATQEHGRASAAIGEKVKGIDVEGFNQAVQGIATAADKISQRLDAVPPDRLRSVADDLSASTAHVRNLTEKLEKTVDAFDLSQVDTVLDESSALLTDVRETVGNLEKDVHGTLQATEQLVNDARQTVASLKVEDLNEAIAEMKETIQNVRDATMTLRAVGPRLDAALGAARTTFHIASGAFVLAGVCCIVWLLRVWRRPPT